jgi:hypothetical protein
VSVRVNEEFKLHFPCLLAWAGLLKLENCLSWSLSSQDVGLLSVTWWILGNSEQILAGDTENAFVVELAVLLPFLAVLFVLNSSHENNVSNVDVKTVILQFFDLELVVQVN